ncbi:MAG: hypothetical protein KDI39_13995, partial [Pseudomonadales bacterium]|nr:hypothetical protein [Pseudomonadales bacterium]
LTQLSELVSRCQNFQLYDQQQRTLCMICLATAKTIKNLMEAQLLADDGSLVNISATLIESEQHISKITSVPLAKN